MRVLSFFAGLAIIVIAVSAAAGPTTANAAGRVGESTVAMSPQQEVDSNDDTRVEVQLVVLGAVALLVVGVGISGYLLKKRLGLVAPPPDQSNSSHH